MFKRIIGHKHASIISRYKANAFDWRPLQFYAISLTAPWLTQLQMQLDEFITSQVIIVWQL